MCFTMLNHVEYVTDPDVKTVFDVRHVGGEIPTQEEMLSWVKTSAKIWMANQVIAKVLEVATASGRVQEVTTPGDVPEMWERGILFTSTQVAQTLFEVAHREVMWIDHHIQLSNKVIMIQLKDFSFVARVSFNELGPDAPPAEEGVLIRRECRIAFNLDIEQAMIYRLPDNWVEVELAKHRPVIPC